ncbi:MAG: iron-containing alcohol dehydrogenase [Firmicutes bacterium]|jgi:alcohol dehydrogenase class IV|nr:iron-containing alcohol dehydrogenase [Bacillota bacterium]
MSFQEFFFPTKILMGCGVHRQAGEQIKLLGGKRPMVVTDKGIVKAGLVQGVTASLEEAGLDYFLFDGVTPDPNNELIDGMAQLARDEGCDSFIGVGGGSSMDAAKLTNIILVHGGSIVEYARGKDVPGPLYPLIAIPTTAGTGSEATRFAVVTDLERQFKKGVSSPYVYPNVALVDYEFIAKQPPHIAAATGMDALTHAIEGYTCERRQEVSDGLALEAIRLIGEHLRPLCAGRGDLQAARGMALGSTIAGISFSNSSTGLVHAMSQAAGAMFGVPHGVGNAIILPHVMEFNLIASLKRFANIAAALGAPVQGKPLREAAQLAVSAVRSLSKDIGIPATLGEVGVPADKIPEMADNALMNVNGIRLNPRQPSREDIIAIFRAAI